MRTARDVLRTPEDQARFANLTSAPLLRVPVDGSPVKIVCGQPGIWQWALSPDEKSVALTRFEQTPLGFAYELFPRVVEVRSVATGEAVKVADVPLDDRSAISSVAALGPRDFEWGPDGKALYFFSWEDKAGADPMAAVKDTSLPQPGTDRLMRLDAPFTGTPTAVATTDFQLQWMLWTSDGKKIVVRESYQPRRRERLWTMDMAQAGGARQPLYERSTEGVYDDPGRPLTRELNHREVAWTTQDGSTIYLSGDGFRSTGQQPFLDAYNLGTREKKRLYESDADHLEPAVALLAPDAKQFITLRQSNREPPNYQVREAGGAPRAIGDATDPAPALTASQRIQFKFTRPDSVKLNGEIVLPADWKPGTPLPTIFWVYPNDYRSAAAASQNRRAPNRFPSQSPLNPEVLVTQGYAVLYPDIAVVGTNDKYVEEIQMSAKAALDEVVRRGWTDPRRVGVGGHSYGAFSTANLLAHTDLFRAGIASDGAYNRTLTPFTFQAEERTLWEARDTYLKMSPFLYADQIKAPLLLLHNMDDTNVGTNPIQSQRMYEALNGLGRTVSLVEYPYEDHGPAAKESVLDYWARVIEWYDKYVKNTPESAAK
jgi:dipeptidyl aminopeptidase/acylaminoacyl peptidase